MLGNDFADHCTAYLYLRRCRPFQRVLQRFGSGETNRFDLAALLAPGSRRQLAGLAIRMLEEELTEAKDGAHG